MKIKITLLFYLVTFNLISQVHETGGSTGNVPFVFSEQMNKCSNILDQIALYALQGTRYNSLNKEDKRKKLSTQLKSAMIKYLEIQNKLSFKQKIQCEIAPIKEKTKSSQNYHIHSLLKEFSESNCETFLEKTLEKNNLTNIETYIPVYLLLYQIENGL